MTENEAIEEFKERLELIEKCYSGEVEDYKQALELGVKALEKQIPKKVNLRHIRKYDGYDDGECPNCGMSVSRECDGNDVFCTDCGQKLDWSDEK